MKQFDLLKIGVFEPNSDIFRALTTQLPTCGADVTLQALNSKFALKTIRDINEPDLAGAFVGNFGGSRKEMQTVIEALRDKYPQSYLIALVQSSRFKLDKINYKIFYDELDSDTLKYMMNNIRATHLAHLASKSIYEK